MIKDITKLTLQEYFLIKDVFPSLDLAIKEKFVQSHNNPFSHLLLYFKNEQLLGVLWYDLIYDRIEICQFEVCVTFQNQHIGSSLLNKLLTIAMEQKVKNITLEVKQSNEKAIYLYKKFGFVPCATRVAYYKGENGILMEKEVTE